MEPFFTNNNYKNLEQNVTYAHTNAAKPLPLSLIINHNIMIASLNIVNPAIN